MKKIISIILASTMIISNVAFASSNTSIYLVNNIKNPTISTTGGDWAVTGLSINKTSTSLYDTYYSNATKIISNTNGIISSTKYTENARVSIAMSAIGKNATNINGYNLLTPLADYSKVISQGINGAIFALIALDSKNYAMPVSTSSSQATRQMYVDYIVSKQNSDGGFGLTSTSNPDVTGMAMQALANYKSQSSVQTSINKAITYLSSKQLTNGGFDDSVESISQVIIGLTAVSVSLSDSRFIKSGNSLQTALNSFLNSDGSYKHDTSASGDSQIATEQAFLAYQAIKNGGSIYKFTNAVVKNSNVSVPSYKSSKTFSDISGNKNETAIKNLASREIINGRTQTTFSPNSTMTRAEFATIIVKALGLTPKTNSKFSDVSSSSWYASYVGTASDYGIITGRTTTSFSPNDTITYQEAQIMIDRATVLCGFATNNNTSNLSKNAILRHEIAGLIYNMLIDSKLI